MNEIQIVYDWLINHFSSELVNTVSILPTSRNGSKQREHLLVNIDFLGKETDEQAIMASFKITGYTKARSQLRHNKLLNDTNYLDNVKRQT
jgi:hypothetical protein